MTWLSRLPELLFLGIAAHALADYVLQSDFIASAKDPNEFELDRAKVGPWWWVMSAHAVTNGAAVWFLMGSFGLGLVETVVHFIADTSKCMGIIDAKTDQLVHVACKVAYAFILCA